jgi:hypothetical protein
VCHFTFSTQDLQYFPYNSSTINLLEKHSLLVGEYHNTLQLTLTLLGRSDLCQSLQQLHKQLDRLGRYGVLIAGTVLPVILADPNNIPDLQKAMEKEQSVHFSERYKDAFKTLLTSFEQKAGWISKQPNV